mmetsp:Transcript_35846/g.40317  ORF Transcript_35846/g.40317 Transcript_35846/m.40317 type:complete len:204 (+) Transcript_35846:218-829(+)
MSNLMMMIITDILNDLLGGLDIAWIIPGNTHTTGWLNIPNLQLFGCPVGFRNGNFHLEFGLNGFDDFATGTDNFRHVFGMDRNRRFSELVTLQQGGIPTIGQFQNGLFGKDTSFIGPFGNDDRCRHFVFLATGNGTKLIATTIIFFLFGSIDIQLTTGPFLNGQHRGTFRTNNNTHATPINGDGFFRNDHRSCCTIGIGTTTS